MDNDSLEQARRYCDDAFELAAEECKALREEVGLLRERIEALEARLKAREGPPRVDGHVGAP